MASRRFYGLTLVVGLLLTVYTFSSSGKFHVVDEVSLFAVTESMGLRGEVNTNAIAWTQWVNSPGEVLGAFGPGGNVYSKKGLGPAIVAVPWHVLLRTLSRLEISMGLLQGTLLWNGLVTALTAALVWLAAVRLGYADRTGAALALLYGMGTIAWPYANQFFGEPLSAFGLTLGLYGVLSWGVTHRLRWAVVSGIGAAFAVLTVTANLMLVVLLAVYGAVETMTGSNRNAENEVKVGSSSNSKRLSQRDLRSVVKMLVSFAAPIMVGGAILLWYNYSRFGNPLDTGYHFSEGEGFTTPLFQGLYGLLLSPYRGLFWFTPLFVASLISAVPFTRCHRNEGILIGMMSLVLILLYSKWWMWWAGFAWGPRFLVPLAPLWILLLAPFVEGLERRIATAWRHDARWSAVASAAGTWGWLFIVVVLISTLVQVSAVAINFVNYEILLRSLYPTDWSNPLAFGPPAQRLGEMLDSPVIGQFKLMQVGAVANSDLAWLWPDGNIQRLVVLVGGAVLLTLVALSLDWWMRAADESGGMPSRPVRWLALVLPILFVGLWISEVSRNPHYGDTNRGYRAVIEDICSQVRPDDIVVTVAPYAYQIPMNWLGAECRHAPPVFGFATDSFEHAETEELMSRALEEYERIWFVTGGLPANDPENLLERWLADSAFKALDSWYDDFRLLAFATSLEMGDVEPVELDVPLVGTRTSQITITGARIPASADAGDAVPIEIYFRIEGPNESNLRWFVQMLTSDGFPVALLDTGPDDGYTPFSALPSQEILIERAGLMLPVDLPSGDYLIIAGLYNPESENLERLRAPNGADFVRLGILTVD
jgi:hypothetical protein